MLWRLLSLLIGYCFGLFQTSYIYGKAHGVDIRKMGSGNAGTTNALRSFGTHVGILVFVGDALKAFLAVFVTELIFKRVQPDIYQMLGLYAGAGCILGHSYPFFMGFKGGKGVACIAGMGLAFCTPMAVIALTIFGIIAKVTGYVSLASIIASSVLPIGCIFLSLTNLFLKMTGAAKFETCVLAFLIVAFIWFRHRANIKRLLNGTERKTKFKQKGEFRK